MDKEEKKRILCAIYTRKSSDENLNSDFTSLDAQRESGEAYIKSQQSEGWELYPEQYNDPGYSGGNMDRPAMQRLLRDAAGGKFNMVIVYKVDRLTRSLKDFTKIIEVLDAAGVSFVAVTQQFNTSSSMGRLTLNVLLSFAQFEREIISERTRDKMAASAKKGKWPGGTPVLGYDIDFEKKELVVNQNELPMIDFMFKTYIETKSSAKTAHAMNNRGYKTKEWVTREGNKKGGASYTESSVRKYLKNPIYLGMIRHKENLYKGRHPAIVDERLFEMVQALLAKNAIQKKSDNKDKYHFILRGLLHCSYCGSFMTPNFAYSHGKPYYYYKCTKVNHLDKTACRIRTTPAREIEKIIIDRLKFLSEDPVLIDKIIKKAKTINLDTLPLTRKELNAQNGELRKIEGEASNLLNILSGNAGDAKKNEFVVKRLDELQERSNALKARIEETKRSIQKLEEQAIDAEVIRRNFKSFTRVFEELKIEEKRELMQLLIKEIQYDADHSKIRVTLRPLPDIGPLMLNTQNPSFDVSSSWLPG